MPARYELLISFVALELLLQDTRQLQKGRNTGQTHGGCLEFRMAVSGYWTGRQFSCFCCLSSSA